MNKKRFAMLGTGFWSRYQLSGWQELKGIECVALYNRTREKAERLAKEFNVPNVYDDVQELIRREELDFIDIVTSPETHKEFVEIAASAKLPVICQKPMAMSYEEAKGMVDVCASAGVPFFVHENYRWQRPLRAVKQVLESGVLGRVFRASIYYRNAYPVFDNQPTLKTVPRFIIADLGTHLLDVSRFLFGEMKDLYCHIDRTRRDIAGEDVATIMMTSSAGATVVCEMSYGTRLETERFAQSFIEVEGEKGSVELGPDFRVAVTTSEGTYSRRHKPPMYRWAHPDYALGHAAIVDCNRDLLRGISGEQESETTGIDNLKTMALVYTAYYSAESHELSSPFE